MEIKISKKAGIEIKKGMMGLFFEDINYAADGGLYAEMIENRSFEFYKASGDAKDYYVEYGGHYGWSIYPANSKVSLKFVEGSPLCEENPHYMRVEAKEEYVGFSNKAYDGIYLEKGMEYEITFFARNIKYDGNFKVVVEKSGKEYGSIIIKREESKEKTYNFFEKYVAKFVASESVEKGTFAILLTEEGIVEFDYISMMPGNAVEGIFRRDLFEKLKELKPGFLRFPGGCIVEGNTLVNRYRFKDSLKETWRRKNNWNRWATHGNNEENNFESSYAFYNQTLGLGYYEYFLLCELIGAKAIPVLNVGLACQYQSLELVNLDSEEFKEFVQDALDLIEFATGDTTTKWGAIRKKMGHEAPFELTMLGIGNEQWQTKEADFFERYEIFEKEVHKVAPNIALIGSAGPDITSERYSAAWKFYEDNKQKENFVYAVDEHYYVKPEWLIENVDFYDEYDRTIKVFSGEYAAHPCSGMNRPEANNLEGAIAEAAFLTGIERNADVVVLASYAPLFARVGYAQWSPDLIWFDGKDSYETPNYFVQKMYANNMGDITLDTNGQEKNLAKKGIHYSISYVEKTETIILKIVNVTEQEKEIKILLEEGFEEERCYEGEIFSGLEKEAYNCIEVPNKIKMKYIEGNLDKISLPPYSFQVLRINKKTDISLN